MSDKLRIHIVAGARPNFMKVGPLYHALKKTNWADPVLVHTGQHFSVEMSDVFLRDLGLPTPHYHLQASGSTHAEQTANVLIAYEKLCWHNRPDWVVVVGDINSTIAATLAAKKLNLFVAHLEAGLRSGDRTMPEEINRLMVDTVADLLWTPSEDADANLLREGISPNRIVRVGNIMIDAYRMLKDRIDKVDTVTRFGLKPLNYVVVTIHRPVNVDHCDNLSIITEQLVRLADSIPVVFVVHPRTRLRLNSFGLVHILGNAKIHILEPLGYIEFMSLVTNCRVVVTDSGGVQEETSYLGVPCLTARKFTERPITLSIGSNQLISISHIEQAAKLVMKRNSMRIKTDIPLWDGHAAERVVDSIFQHKNRTHDRHIDIE
jgi:UDP-N-acetylglucosamine 2-epimerase (non-hydrolysing)